MSSAVFVHLRLHTEFSLQDSVVRIPELVERVVALGMPAIAVTDQNNLFAMVKFYRVMWIAFWINALSGAALLAADATTKLTNPVFFFKLGFIALAVVTMILIRRRVFGNPSLDLSPLTGGAKLLAVTSLIFWTGAITAGRLMAYFGPVSGAPGLRNRIP